MQIKVKKLTSTAKLPTRAYDTDSGLDLYIDHDLVLQPAQMIVDSSQVISEVLVQHKTGNRYLAHTGIAIQLPNTLPTTLGNQVTTFECTIRPKSGLSSKGLYVALGTIDNSYTGELKVVMINLSNEVMVFNQGDKIAQLIVQIVYLPQVIEVQELEKRDRDDKGFGSTGK